MKMYHKKENVNLGQKLLSWHAPDYHPHKRGMLWHVGFCAVMFGSAAFFVYWDREWGWVSAFIFCLVAAIYFWVHKDDATIHKIEIYKNSLVVDKRHVLPFEWFEGYWVFEDPYTRLIIFEYKKKRYGKTMLQLADVPTEKIKKTMKKTRLPELPPEAQKESMTDLWIRALKL